MKTNQLLLSLATASALMSGGVNAKPLNKQKTNIIYILADDLGIGDLGIMGQTKIETPNIDRLGKEGMVFTNHYSGSTVCAPSRCALMTGKHMGHATIRENFSKQKGRVPLMDEDVTIAELLKQEGYATGCSGKWGLGEIGTAGVPWKQGYDYFYGYINQRNAHSYYPPFLYENANKILLEANNNHQKEIYSEDLIISKTLKFIDDNHKKPFFFYFAVTLPHADLELPEKYVEKYMPKLQSGEWSKPMVYYAAMVSKLDADVGAILDKIKALGLDEQTMVVFASDNGAHQEDGLRKEMFNSTGGFRGYKRDLYEGGIHVPMMVRWPGKVKPGSSTDHISAFWDVLPTVCDITGADKPKDIDGISFLPTLLDKKQKNHEYLYWEHLLKGKVKQAVRFGQWKAVRYSLDKDIEIYNLESDPKETKNLAASYPNLVKKAKQMFKDAHTESEYFPFN
ncbi:DUF4976 domain-containing protein [Puteibacter caeruleilacunae]|nr:DUF4976 domain-containing protein [Puteibacter caeruleilacunae]